MELAKNLRDLSSIIGIKKGIAASHLELHLDHVPQVTDKEHVVSVYCQFLVFFGEGSSYSYIFSSYSFIGWQYVTCAIVP